MSKVKDAAEKILKGQDTLNGMFAELEGKIFFSGKTLLEWKEFFHLTIPPDLNTVMCKELGGKLMSLYQEASFYYSFSEMKVRASKSASENSISETYINLINQYRMSGKKVPAAATLDNHARVESNEMLNSQTLAEIEHNFWKRIISQLDYCRKIIENATMNIAIEQKGIRSNYIENINSEDEI